MISKMKLFRIPLAKDKDGKDIKVPFPVYASAGSACMDILSANLEPITIMPGETVKIPSGLKLAIDPGYQLKVLNRSGLSTNSGIVLAHACGTVDSDYRGEVFIPLRNVSNTPYIVEPFSRVCQGEIIPAPQYTFSEIFSEDELGETQRGQGGFGSTGSTKLASRQEKSGEQDAQKMTEEELTQFLLETPTRADIVQFVENYSSGQLVPFLTNYINAVGNKCIGLISICQSILVDSGAITEEELTSLVTKFNENHQQAEDSKNSADTSSKKLHVVK